jgi:hypothetical protein
MPVYRGDIPSSPKWHEYQGLDDAQKMDQWALDLEIYLEQYLGLQGEDIRQIGVVSDTVTDLDEGGILFASSGGAVTQSSNLVWDDTNNALTIGDGAVGAPSLSFVSDTDTGIYIYEDGGGGKRLCVSIDGVKVIDIDDAALFLADSASVYEASIAWSGTAMTQDRALAIDLEDGNRTLKLPNPTFDSLTLNLTTQDYLLTERAETLAIQGQSSGQGSVIDLFTKDGDATDSAYFEIFGLGTPGSVANRELLAFGWNSGSSIYIISSVAAGAGGTVRPLHVYTGANTNQLVLNIDGTVSFASSVSTGALTASSILCSLIGIAGDTDLLQLSANALVVNGSVTGTSFVTGGNIGISGDTDLLQLAANALTLNGSLSALGTITLGTTNEIDFRDTDISLGSTLSDGILDASADTSIRMFYDNADVGDGNDGQSLYIYRRAAEADDYMRFYHTDARVSVIDASYILRLKRAGIDKISIGSTTTWIYNNVDIDGTVSTTSDDNWDLNDYTAGTVTDTGYVTVTINGTAYKLLARLEP